MASKKDITYREPTIDDAEAMVKFYNRVGGETTYLSFEENEYPLDVEGQKNSILHVQKQPNCITILALADDQIVAIGTISAETKIKARHCGILGIVVEKAHQGVGIGRALMNQLIDYCRENPIITKIQLDTRTDNQLAVDLYKRCGFEIEGEIKNSTLIDGAYYHLYVMGMMV